MSEMLVVGLGVTGVALVREAQRRGWTPLVVEDRPGGEDWAERVDLVEQAGGRVVEHPDDELLGTLVRRCDIVVPSPGVPMAHPVYDLARSAGTPLVSEIELGGSAGRGPIVAVTGTNGKTTVTTLIAEMLETSGLRAVAAGNIGRPLVEAVSEDADVVVVEVSSFQLQHTSTFRPRVAVVLNVADDHFDWHPDLDHYRAAKARIFANQTADDVLVVNADDPVTLAMGERAPGRVVHFTAGDDPAAYHVAEGALRSPGGVEIVPVTELPRHHPHDLLNALAASASARAAGAELGGIATALRAFTGLPHRLTPVGEAGGVTYVDDSKATNPHATVHAVRGFDSVVLLVGGRNKGLDLNPLRGTTDRVRLVVAFGEAAPEIVETLAGAVPVEQVDSVPEAVEAATRHARAGDTVLFSPGCASFDAYPHYRARGDDFAAHVAALIGGADG